MDWIKKKRMEIGLAAAVVLMIAAICIYNKANPITYTCLLYTSDAADE